MIYGSDFDDDRELDEAGTEAACPGDRGVPGTVVAALDAMRRLCAGEWDFLVAEGRLAGLETGVVLAVTPGGLVPLFAHVSRDIFPVLVPAAAGDGDETRSQGPPAGVH